jgi:hypothetical protein
MIQVTRYTTSDAIRGSLGVDPQDCSDEVIASSNLEVELEVDLDGWLPNHDALFTTGTATGATASEKTTKNLILLYSQWFCAFELASRFLLFPQIVTDGKNQMNRFAKVDLDRVKDLAASRMNKYKSSLDELVNSTTQSVLPIISVAIPDNDPVTNT